MCVVDLARVKDGHKRDEEHHVAGEGAEDKGAGAIEGLARAAAGTSPVVVASSAASAGGPAVDRRLAAGAGGFALDVGRDGSKDRGHGRPCEDEVTSLLIGRAENRKRWLGIEKEIQPRTGLQRTSYVLWDVCTLSNGNTNENRARENPCEPTARPLRCRRTPAARSAILHLPRCFPCERTASVRLDGQSYQPRVCRSCDSSRAAAARPFMVPVTCSLTSARILGSL